MTAKTDLRLKAAEALMALLAEKDWSRIGLAEIAAQAKLSLAELRALVPVKEALLPVLAGEIDRRVLDGLAAGDENLPVRDRLFDVLMRRIETLTPYKPAFKRLADEGIRAPLAGLAIAFSVDRAMPWMLEAAGIPSAGLAGRIKAKALAAVYLCAVKAWLKDDSADLGPTMGALDKALNRAESLHNLLPQPLRACLLGEKPPTHQAID
jgi:AcrR family transcriptional regulator